MNLKLSKLIYWIVLLLSAAFFGFVFVGLAIAFWTSNILALVIVFMLGAIISFYFFEIPIEK